MKQELDEALCRDFPTVFKDRHADMRQTAMCWGFPGDGWEPLIRECASKLEAINKKITDPDRQIHASQVKEKFGGLRFYTTSYPAEYGDEVEVILRDAEKKSYETCERCGAPGKIRTEGWIVTLCDECEGNRPYQYR